jgi:hypothetical protein
MHDLCSSLLSSRLRKAPQVATAIAARIALHGAVRGHCVIDPALWLFDKVRAARTLSGGQHVEKYQERVGTAETRSAAGPGARVYISGERCAEDHAPAGSARRSGQLEADKD